MDERTEHHDRLNPVVEDILDRVTAGDFARMPERIGTRAMRAWLRLMANPHSHTAPADARYIKLALIGSMLWEPVA